MAQEKVVFVAFAIEDERQRDFLRASRCTLAAVRVRRYVGQGGVQDRMEGPGPYAHPPLRRCDRVRQRLAEVQRPEVGVQCAKEEKKKLIGIWAYTMTKTKLDGVRTVTWTDANVSSSIDWLYDFGLSTSDISMMCL